MQKPFSTSRAMLLPRAKEAYFLKYRKMIAFGLKNESAEKH